MTIPTTVRPLASIDPAEPPHRLRRDRWTSPSVLVGLLISVGLLGLLAVGAGVLVRGQAVNVEEQRDAAVADKRSLAEQIQSECAAGRLMGPVCGQAATIVAEPVPAPALSQGELAAAVADYLRRNPPPPGRAPTTEEIAGAATAYLRDNPPQPGRPPTPGEVAAAVAAYLAENPPAAGRDGENGPSGEPGRPPTAQEIRAAVDAALAADPPPPGPQGVGVQSVRAEQTDAGCVLIFVLIDPADQMTTEQAVPVPDGICDGGLLGP